jgi:hypothetical protein
MGWGGLTHQTSRRPDGRSSGTKSVRQARFSAHTVRPHVGFNAVILILHRQLDTLKLFR